MQHIIYVTEKCNLDCKYCHSKKLSDFESIVSSKVELINTLKKLKNNGIKKIDFSGGEPALIKELPSYIKITRRYFDSVGILTNGMLLSNKELLQKYIVNGMNYIYVTVHDIDEANCRKICGDSYNIKKLFWALKNLSKTELFVNIGVVINNVNKSNLIKLMKRIIKILGKDRLRVEISYVILSSPRKEAKKFLIKSEELKEATLNLIGYLESEGIPNCITTCFGPFCLVGERIDKFIEFQSFLGSNEATSVMERKERNKFARVKIESCKKCVFNHICDGIFSGNLKFEGKSNYKPLSFNQHTFIKKQDLNYFSKIYKKHAPSCQERDCKNCYNFVTYNRNSFEYCKELRKEELPPLTSENLSKGRDYLFESSKKNFI